MVSTDSKSMDHGFEAHVDLATTNDFGNIGRIIGLQDGNLDALLLEVPLGLGNVEGCMVWRSMPLRSVS